MTNYRAGNTNHIKVHILRNVDAGARTADCDHCGPTALYASGTSWRCAEASKKGVREWRRRHPRESRRESFWWALKSNYRLSPEAYGAMLVSQDFQCGICGCCLLTRSVVVDHNHDTGRVRGLLCSPCNGNEGWFRKHKDAILRWQA